MKFYKQLLVLYIKKKYLNEPRNVTSSVHLENTQPVQAEVDQQRVWCLTQTSKIVTSPYIMVKD